MDTLLGRSQGLSSMLLKAPLPVPALETHTVEATPRRGDAGGCLLELTMAKPRKRICKNRGIEDIEDIKTIWKNYGKLVMFAKIGGN